jgi:hypothetical protein
MDCRQNDWHRKNGVCRCCTLFLHSSPFDLRNTHGSARSVPIASRNSVNYGYDINIKYLRKNGKRPHEKYMGKKYPLVLSTCELNIHLTVSDFFVLARAVGTATRGSSD